jgi:hypothetical protein
MGKRSSDKGKEFERYVAKHLSATYDDHFIRVPRSGAYVGGKNAIRKATMTEGQIRASKGDIIPPDNWTSFNCECKWYKTLEFHLLFKPQYALIDSWIQEVRDSEEPGDVNIILIRINYKGQYAMFEHKHPFDVDHSLNYNEWSFCAWDSFWTPHNTSTLLSLAAPK